MNKINERMSQKGRRFTILDFLICVMAVGIAVYIGFNFFTSENRTADNNIIYTFKYQATADNIEKFQKGDDVLSADGEKIIGKITNVEIEEISKDQSYSEIETSLDSDLSMKSESDEKDFFVIVTVSAQLDYDSGNYYLNGVPVKLGNDIELTTKNYSAIGKCESISKAESNQ